MSLFTRVEGGNCTLAMVFTNANMNVFYCVIYSNWKFNVVSCQEITGLSDTYL
jgi:hypothetical protein